MSEPATLVAWLEGNSARRPERTAVVQGERSLSWRQFDAATRSLAVALRRQAGSGFHRVGLFADLTVEGAVAFWGLIRAGVSAAPLPTSQTHQVLLALARDSRLRFVVATRFQAPGLAQAFGVTVPPPDSDLAVLDLDHGDWSPLPLDSPRGALPSIAPEDEFNVIYSSGTTSTPKGVVHAHRTRLARAGTYQSYGFSPKSRTLISTPIYSNWSVLAMAVAVRSGGSMCLLPKSRPAEFLRAARTLGATHAFMVPTQLERCLALPDFPEACGGHPMIRFCSASPLRAEVKRRSVEAWPGRLYEAYGMTEGSLSTFFDVASRLDKLDSVGLPAPGSHIVILGEDGQPVVPGAVGEIVGRSPAMMEGYLNRPAETEAIVWRDAEGRRHFRTGDLGRIDEEGFLHIMGRAKDMIISGGINIYACDLEEVLHQHPGVREAAVVAAADPEWGETPVAFVSLENGSVSGETLREWANARLARTHRISAVRILPELPRGVLDKVAKAELRTLLNEPELSAQS